MVTLDTLTENDIQDLFSVSAYGKAHDLVKAVRAPERIADSLRAQVQGTDLYAVAIDVKHGQIVATCTCPYEWEGHCKHIGAVLLKWLYQRQSFVLGALEDVEAPPAPTPVGQPHEYPLWMQQSGVDRQSEYHQNFETWLEEFRLSDLREIAQRRGWVVRGTRKADVVTAVAEQMTNPANIAKTIQQLNPKALPPLRAIALVGGFTARRDPDVYRVARLWSSESDAESAKRIVSLMEQGLAFPPSPYNPEGPQTPFIPQSLARWYPRLLADVVPHNTHLPTDDPAMELRLSHGASFVRSVLQVFSALESLAPPLRTRRVNYAFEAANPMLRGWDYDQAQVESLAKQGQLRRYSNVPLSVPPPAPVFSDEVMARLSLIAGGESRLEFIYALLTATGLLLLGSPVRAWDEVKVAFLRHDEAAQHGILSRVYFDMITWSELWPVLRANPDLTLMRLLSDPYRSSVSPQSLHAELAGFRRLILRMLSYLPDDAWVKLDDLFPVLRAMWPRFDQGYWLRYHNPSTTAGSWFLWRDGKALAADSDLDWQLGQGAFFQEMLIEPLHWLGLVDLAVSRGAVTHVRLHGLADLFWNRVDKLPLVASPAPALPATVAAPADALSVEDDVIRLDPVVVGAAAHTLLDRIARLERAQPHQFVYRLDPAAVHQAFESGTDLQQIVGEWQAALGSPMPDAIQARLAEWWQTYGTIRLYQNVTVIEFGDDYALTEMKAITSLEKVMIAEVSPRLVIIPREAADTLAAELTRAGYTPQRADGNV